MALERDEVPVVLLFLGGRALALVAQQREAPDAERAARNKIEQREGPEGVRGRQDLAFVGADHFLMLLAARRRLGVALSFDTLCLRQPAALERKYGLSAAHDERLTGNDLAPGACSSG